MTVYKIITIIVMKRGSPQTSSWCIGIYTLRLSKTMVQRKYSEVIKNVNRKVQEEPQAEAAANP